MSPVYRVWPKPPCKAQWNGGEDKADRKRWEDNIRVWTGLEFGKSQRAVENREKWRKLVAKSSVVPQRPSRLKDWWWWWWWWWNTTRYMETITRKRWRWIGHYCARMPPTSPKLQSTGPQREGGSVVDQRQPGEELWKRKWRTWTTAGAPSRGWPVTDRDGGAS